MYLSDKKVHPRQRIDIAAVPAPCVILNHLYVDVEVGKDGVNHLKLKCKDLM